MEIEIQVQEMLRSTRKKKCEVLHTTLQAERRLIVARRVYTGRMKELIKRVDPNWLRIWLVCYGGSLSILTTYLLSILAKFGLERIEER